MNEKDFDVILDASDKNFIADFTNALGLKPGEKINIITPQFERTDGRVITYRPKTPKEYKALKMMQPDNLKKIGCQVWGKKDGKTYWLYPAEWYDHIPNGTEIVNIFGNVKTFKYGETSKDMRSGALGYGFVQQEH